MSSQVQLPHGWEGYDPMKNVIEGTRFLAFKTPFDESSGQLCFRASDLLDQVGNLGLVLNLVNTTRYYNPEIFRRRNVEYHHIRLLGFGNVPPEADIKRVFSRIDRFIEENGHDNRRLIGVHCTHGVNRTGYVICRYMIQKLGFKPDEAIRVFVEGRGYSFDRAEYRKVLLNLAPSVDSRAKRWHSICGEIERSAL